MMTIGIMMIMMLTGCCCDRRVQARFVPALATYPAVPGPVPWQRYSPLVEAAYPQAHSRRHWEPRGPSGTQPEVTRMGRAGVRAGQVTAEERRCGCGWIIYENE